MKWKNSLNVQVAGKTLKFSLFLLEDLRKVKRKNTEWIILIKYGVLRETGANMKLDKMANYLSA